MHWVGPTICRLSWNLFFYLSLVLALGACSQHQAEYETFKQSDQDAHKKIIKNEAENISEYIQNENLEQLKTLITTDSQLNQLLPNGRTPLMEAIYWNKKAVVTFFLNQGASKDIKDDTGRSAFDYAGDKKEILFLLNPQLLLSTRQELFDAIAAKDIEKIKQLLDEGINLNFLFSSGETPLIYAIKSKNDSLVRVFLQYPQSLDIEFKDQNNLTASDWALKLSLKRTQKMIENFRKDLTHE